MLQQIYNGSWHLPGVAFLSISLLFLSLARRSSFITGFTALFAWLIAADAWVNGAGGPLAKVPTPLVVFFVIAGDWRYFLLLERYRSGSLNLARVVRSFAFACLVPLVTLAAIVSAGNKLDMRGIFLFYEVAVLLLALGVWLVILPRWTDASAGSRAFLVELTQFELVQYGLWAIADVLLIFGHSWAMGLRLTANIFYYALFLPFVWWRAPESPARRQAVVPLSGLMAAALALSFLTLKFAPPAASSPAPAAAAALSFLDGKTQVATLSLSSIESLPVEEVKAFDPYYLHDKRWRAVAIENLLRKGFQREPAALIDQDFVLRAMDGFAAYMPGKLLLEGGAYVAIADLDVPDWEPIGPKRDNPEPFYLVWAKPEQQNLDTHARPWQLASIERVSFDSQFPHVRPQNAPSASAAGRGFEIFRIQCLACHAINREGGQVGPELNLPRNILEYRDAAVVRAFIKNPLAFRYTVMPPHPGLSNGDLDDLIAYLSMMKSQKYDHSAAAASGAH